MPVGFYRVCVFDLLTVLKLSPNLQIFRVMDLGSFLQNEAVLRACAEPPPSKTSRAGPGGVGDGESTSSQATQQN